MIRSERKHAVSLVTSAPCRCQRLISLLFPIVEGEPFLQAVRGAVRTRPRAHRSRPRLEGDPGQAVRALPDTHSQRVEGDARRVPHRRRTWPPTVNLERTPTAGHRRRAGCETAARHPYGVCPPPAAQRAIRRGRRRAGDHRRPDAGGFSGDRLQEPASGPARRRADAGRRAGPAARPRSERAAERGRVLGECSNLARELSNEPGNMLTPRSSPTRRRDRARGRPDGRGPRRGRDRASSAWACCSASRAAAPSRRA